MIFVFGSNLAGHHGAGAAAFAATKLNYPYELGVGINPDFTAYAIPTKDCDLKPLPLRIISLYVAQFLVFAETDRENQFKVTQVGCGLAGFKPEQIAPKFRVHPPNCLFDEAWKPWLDVGTKYWGTL